MEVDGGKRKREEDQLPSITYLVGDRSFDRLFKEQSLEEIQNVVRRKLQLPSNSTVKLKQLRGSKVIDLDDDDDFDAFSARARLMKLVDVAVEISTSPAQEAIPSASTREASKTSETGMAKKKRKANNDQPPKDANSTVAPEPKTKKQKTEQPAVTKHTETAPTSKVASNDSFVREFIERLGRKEPAPVSAPAESPPKPSAKLSVLISTKAPVPTDGEPSKKKPKVAKAGIVKDDAEKPPKKTKKAKETEQAKGTSSLPVSDDHVAPAPSGPSEPPKKSLGTKKITTQSSALQSAEGEKSVNGVVGGAAASKKKKQSKVKGREVESESEAAPSEPAPETSGSFESHQEFLVTNDFTAASTKGRKKVANAGASEAPAPKERAKKHRLTIKDLESLLKSPIAAVPSAKRDAADTTKPSRKPLETDDESEGEATKADKESQPSWTPLVPSHSLLSEVTVESRNEGSSSEEEDEIAQEPERKEPEQEEPEQEEHEPELGQASLEDVDLDAIMRGPGPIKLRKLIDTLESKEEEESDTEDEGGDIGPLEVEDDGENERKYRRLSRRWVNSSEEEGDEDDESEQHSTPRLKQNISEPLASTAAPKPSVGPDETSNATNPAGSKKDGVQGDAFDTDVTRVSVSKVQDGDKDSTKDAGKAPEVVGLDKASDTSPARADDLMDFQHVITSDNDPIEITTPPTQKTAKLLSPVAHSTPKSGLAKRMKNRHGQLPSPLQFPVRADESKVNGSQRAGTERKKNAATRAGNDKPLIRNGNGATRADLLRISSQPVKRSTNSNGHGATPSHSQPLPKAPASLAKWSVLREPSPSMLMDELDSSLIGQGGMLGKLAGKAPDQNSAGEHSDDDSADKAGRSLFTLPASQVPFPHSQYNASIQKRMEIVPDSESESEAEAGGKKKTTNAKTSRSIPPYRRLTDIASQASLFSQSTPVAPHSSTLTNGMGGRADDDDDDDDDDSSSESDDEGQSHIPQGKRAGNLRSKKTKGLLASMVY
ncbi:uncharacterized protein BJ212DRAFT_1484544 [Suillus subaureus]|uniref:Uncharacterized protein n=1 Tax=Suillus subaureus TaxID=48587 RepID=A0A9P7J9C8_9AGAM|nr:uncharacterized protein BJ212DRAFT_1484544 [Suillus subaureus]KAG1809426.1 hypothetical protein BJ212DRAFT_1484544 [Suillus subaureus]